MACGVHQYYWGGQCVQCPVCPAGQELSQDCGHGQGAGVVCVQCEQRWFKSETGSHACRKCQTCRHLNRQEVTTCTHTHNSLCGECIPGFYSKRRLDGRQDLECLPCGPAPFRNNQCRSDAHNVEKLWSSEAPPSSVVVMTIACVTAVTMATAFFIVMVLMYKGFKSLKTKFKGCWSPGSSRRDITSVTMTTENTLTQQPEEERTDLCHTCSCSVSMVMTSDPCSDITPALVSTATASEDTPPAQLTTELQACAGEQSCSWTQHTPVECSELDLHTHTHSASPERERERERAGERAEL